MTSSNYDPDLEVSEESVKKYLTEEEYLEFQQIVEESQMQFGIVTEFKNAIHYEKSVIVFGMLFVISLFFPFVWIVFWVCLVGFFYCKHRISKANLELARLEVRFGYYAKTCNVRERAEKEAEKEATKNQTLDSQSA
jgi:Ca2+-dependent lipid-binding protein